MSPGQEAYLRAPLGGAGSPSNVARAEVYLQAKFHPSNRLATIHQRHRQTEQDKQDRTSTV